MGLASGGKEENVHTLLEDDDCDLGMDSLVSFLPPLSVLRVFHVDGCFMLHKSRILECVVACSAAIRDVRGVCKERCSWARIAAEGSISLRKSTTF